MAARRVRKTLGLMFILIALGLIVISIIIGKIESHSTKSTLNISCSPASNSTSGTYSFKLKVGTSSDYRIWINLESPVNISFTNVPGTYNPLFMLVDNKYCYEIGGTQLQPNTWTWVNYPMNAPTTQPFSIYLIKGNHSISILSTYVSIDRVEVLDSDCIPIAMGTNCVGQ